MTEKEIIELCEKYKIEYYKINPDMTVDIDGFVAVWNADAEIPFQFGKVTDYFDWSKNKITSLKGCPSYVGDYFSCKYNNITSLEFGPEYVGNDFICSQNDLTSLKYCPKYVGGDFWCIMSVSNNRLPISEYRWLLYSQINGDIYTNNNKLDEFLNKWKNCPKKDLPLALSELRKMTL